MSPNQMIEHDRLRTFWLEKYETLDHFSEWFDLMVEMREHMKHQIAMPPQLRVV